MLMFCSHFALKKQNKKTDGPVKMFWVALYFFCIACQREKTGQLGNTVIFAKKNNYSVFFNYSHENTNNSHRLHKFTVLNKLRFCSVRIGNYRLTKLLITFKMN